MTVIHLNRFPDAEETPENAIMISNMYELPTVIDIASTKSLELPHATTLSRRVTMASLRDQLGGLVYSTEHGKTCPECREALDAVAVRKTVSKHALLRWMVSYVFAVKPVVVKVKVLRPLVVSHCPARN